MKITDFITVTELSRLSGKSRPTLYKYIEAFEYGKNADVPPLFLELFNMIREGCTRSAMYRYCEEKFDKQETKSTATDDEILKFIRSKEGLLNWDKIKNIIDKETK